eukprot:scaffold63407_cov63-Phaeocystis_antarctica.AAC.5
MPRLPLRRNPVVGQIVEVRDESGGAVRALFAGNINVRRSSQTNRLVPLFFALAAAVHCIDLRVASECALERISHEREAKDVAAVWQLTEG